MVSKEKKHNLCEEGIEKSVTRITDWHHKAKNPSLAITVCHQSASLVMPIGDPRDGFFYPTLSLMLDTYNHRCDQRESFCVIILNSHQWNHVVHV